MRTSTCLIQPISAYLVYHKQKFALPSLIFGQYVREGLSTRARRTFYLLLHISVAEWLNTNMCAEFFPGLRASPPKRLRPVGRPGGQQADRDLQGLRPGRAARVCGQARASG